jgi:hypothetical protein
LSSASAAATPDDVELAVAAAFVLLPTLVLLLPALLLPALLLQAAIAMPSAAASTAPATRR